MKKYLLILSLFVVVQISAQSSHVKIEPVNFSKVNVTDAFWKPKMDLVATKTLAACIYQTEEKTGRIRNFEKVARNRGEKHEGIFYDDSDVYKAIEAMAYSIKTSYILNLIDILPKSIELPSIQNLNLYHLQNRLRRYLNM